MDIRFFASNPIIFFMGTEDGSRKTPACRRAGMYRIFQSADKNLNGYPIYWHNCVQTFNFLTKKRGLKNQTSEWKFIFFEPPQ
jgi:hypothetical protein